MNIDYFLKRYADVLMNDKHDNVFENLKIITGGTTSSRIAKLLNFAVSQIDDSECYLEVGVYNGTTLCSASYNNEKDCIGIDNYNQGSVEYIDQKASDVKNRCLNSIRCISNKIKLIDKDFREVKKEEIEKPVAVAFIDGKHDYPSVVENFEWLEPLLSDSAIIVLDDVNYLEVSKAMGYWIGKNGNHYDLLTYIKPFYQDNRYISSLYERFLNNGVAIIMFNRKHEYGVWMIDPKEKKDE